MEMDKFLEITQITKVHSRNTTNSPVSTKEMYFIV